MKRLFAVLLIVAAAFGSHSVAPTAAKAGGVSFGIGIGYGYPVYRSRYYRPRYYRPRYYRPRYYRPRYYRPRYVRPRRVYRRRAVRRRFSAAHYGYCSSKYRSYRARDNTFQPYRGGRRQCRSRY